MSTPSERYQKLRKAGRCTCGQPSEFLSTKCAKCKQRQRERHALKQTAKIRSRAAANNWAENPAKPKSYLPEDHTFHRTPKRGYLP